jgi:hypothetical protein
MSQGLASKGVPMSMMLMMVLMSHGEDKTNFDLSGSKIEGDRKQPMVSFIPSPPPVPRSLLMPWRQNWDDRQDGDDQDLELNEIKS